MKIKSFKMIRKLSIKIKKNRLKKLYSGLKFHTKYWYNPFVKTYFNDYYKKTLLFGFIPIKREFIDFSFPVDLVYLWVDGNDENWRAKKNYWQQQIKGVDSQAVTDGRFIDNEELKYSLRSAEKYAPWINKIFIVTDEQIPQWLDTSHPKIKVVFHKDFIPQKYLPLFNSEAIESFLPYIPELSEHFIYACDDYYFGKNTKKSFFYMPDGKAVIRLKKQVSKKHIQTSMYTRSILKMQNIIRTNFGKNYPYAPHHNIDAYTKSAFIEGLKFFETDFENTATHKFRTEGDIQRVVISYYMLAKGYAKLKLYSRVNKFFSLYKRFLYTLTKKYAADSLVINMNNKNPYHKLKKYKPSLFCTNDGEGITDFDRRRTKIFLEEKFPQKSSFEF